MGAQWVGRWQCRTHCTYQQGIAADGVVDIRLLLSIQANGLGVAAALKVEDAFIIPAMLVVANEEAMRISRQRRLASAREAKEEGSVAVLALVGGAMHGHVAVQGQAVVHLMERERGKG